MESPQQPPYLVIDGIELGEDDAIDEPWCLGHGVISQGLVELDLRGEKRSEKCIGGAATVQFSGKTYKWVLSPSVSQEQSLHTHQLIHSLVSHQCFPNEQDQVGSVDSDEFGQRGHQGHVVLHAARRVHQHHVKALVPSWGGREAA